MSVRSGQETEEGKEIDVTPRRVNNPAAIGSMKMNLLIIITASLRAESVLFVSAGKKIKTG